jgi:tRNA 2-thiouridine synthesizing protein A
MRAAKIMLAMKVGQTLRVLATDPATVQDFDAYVRGSGNVLLESKKTPKGDFEFLLKRAK